MGEDKDRLRNPIYDSQQACPRFSTKPLNQATVTVQVRYDLFKSTDSAEMQNYFHDYVLYLVHVPRQRQKQRQKPKLWFVLWNLCMTNKPIVPCIIILRAWFVGHRLYPERTKTFVVGFVLAHEQPSSGDSPTDESLNFYLEHLKHS